MQPIAQKQTQVLKPQPKNNNSLAVAKLEIS